LRYHHHAVITGADPLVARGRVRIVSVPFVVRLSVRRHCSQSRNPASTGRNPKHSAVPKTTLMIKKI
jgi:hypothetical protein